MSPNTFPWSQNTRNGFTFVETLIVAAAISLLAVLAVPAYLKHQNNSDIEQAVNDISVISIAVAKYQLANNKLPDDLSVLDMNNMQDPWGVPYQYITHKASLPKIRRKNKNLIPVNNDYDLFSNGKDGSSAPALSEKFSHDDIVRANNGKWIGLSKKY